MDQKRREESKNLKKEGGRKDDSGKLRYDLIPPKALAELARVFTIGAKKYDDWNWSLGINWSQIYAALMRHIEAWRQGEQFDPLDGQKHLASVAWAAMILSEYEDFRKDLDDRPHTKIEKWKSFPGYPQYQISTQGRVRKIYAQSTQKRYKKSLYTLISRYKPEGYKYVTMYNKNRRKNFYIHRLVLSLFVRLPIKSEIVNHRNGKRDDNRVENLEWVTPSGNLIDSYRRGRKKLSPRRRKVVPPHFEDNQPFYDRHKMERNINDIVNE